MGVVAAGGIMKIGIFDAEVGDHGFFGEILAAVTEVNEEQGMGMILSSLTRVAWARSMPLL